MLRYPHVLTHRRNDRVSAVRPQGSTGESASPGCVQGVEHCFMVETPASRVVDGALHPLLLAAVVLRYYLDGEEPC